MKVVASELPGVLLFEPKVFGDDRGYFLETWNSRRYAAAGLELDFIQDNLSFSRQGTLRGLHFQRRQAQGKLITVLQGEVYDVAVDIRSASPTFGKWAAYILSAENHRQLYVPPGFAHGFCVTSETALFSYKVTEYYSPQFEATIAWDDPDLAIPWPVGNPILSAKDQTGMRLREYARDAQTGDACNVNAAFSSVR